MLSNAPSRCYFPFVLTSSASCYQHFSWVTINETWVSQDGLRRVAEGCSHQAVFLLHCCSLHCCMYVPIGESPMLRCPCLQATAHGRPTSAMRSFAQCLSVLNPFLSWKFRLGKSMFILFWQLAWPRNKKKNRDKENKREREKAFQLLIYSPNSQSYWG